MRFCLYRPIPTSCDVLRSTPTHHEDRSENHARAFGAISATRSRDVVTQRAQRRIDNSVGSAKSRLRERAPIATQRRAISARVQGFLHCRSDQTSHPMKPDITNATGEALRCKAGS